jgi:hypothetical protein
MSDRGQKTVADSRHVAISGKYYHWHAHPKRLARRRCTVIWKRIQRDIDAVVQRKMRSRVRGSIQEINPIHREFQPCESLGVAGFDRNFSKARALQNQSGHWHRLQ